jgi:hypothetical protein
MSSLSQNLFIVPVSAHLRTVLVQVEREIERYGSIAVNDRNEYPKVAVLIERLVLAVMQPPTGLRLIGPASNTARINMGPNLKLVSKVAELTGYLNVTATNLLSPGVGSLSAYSSDNTERALNHLKGLYYLITASIRDMATEDLRDVRESGVWRLLAVADSLAATASAPSAEPESGPIGG